MTDIQKMKFKERAQPIIAWRAMKELLKDKERTDQVFIILRALGGGEIKKNLTKFRATETGQKVLSEQREIIDILNDREALAQMPEGSLGREYLKFVISENLTADGLVAASDVSENPREDIPEDFLRFQLRLRDSHDLWHVTTDYERDGLGELCLLAFTYAQTRNKGLAFIVAIATLSDMRRYPKSKVVRAVREGYRHGNQAEWLVAADWEALLHKPLAQVRGELGFRSPSQYRWSLDFLKEMGAMEIVGDPAAA